MNGHVTTEVEETVSESEPLLSIRDLTVEFHTYKGSVHAVSGVDLDIERGQTVGLVGETGSGKTVTARSILQLIDDPGRIVDGSIQYKGRDLLDLGRQGMQSIRGSEIAMVFQEPKQSLNPVFTVGQQVKLVMRHNLDKSESELHSRAVELMSELGLPDPEEVLTSYPHELSGGMAQRVLIAIALAGEPDVILADEPTTALDVTIQSQILNLFDRIQDEFDTSILLITHNLGVVNQISDYVNIMYAGQIVERGPTEDVFTAPNHPYTNGLLEALPERAKGRIKTIEGDVPDLRNPPEGCRFESRCPVAKPECTSYDPVWTRTGEQREVRCVHYESDRTGSPEAVDNEF